MLQSALVSSRVLQSAPVSSRVLQSAPMSSRVHQSAPECFKVSQWASKCIRALQSAAIVFEVAPKCLKESYIGRNCTLKDRFFWNFLHFFAQNITHETDETGSASLARPVSSTKVSSRGLVSWQHYSSTENFWHLVELIGFFQFWQYITAIFVQLVRKSTVSGVQL